MNNIAEGFCSHGDKEFHHFLNIAKASCGELKNKCYLAEDIGYIKNNLATDRRLAANNLMNGIGKFMSYLRKSNKLDEPFVFGTAQLQDRKTPR